MYYKKVQKQRLGYSGLCKNCCSYLKGQKSLHQIHITKVSTNLYILTICLFIVVLVIESSTVPLNSILALALDSFG